MLSNPIRSSCYTRYLLLLGLTSSSAFADVRQTLDWVPLSQLTLSQQQSLPAGSCGAYISPLAERSISNLDDTPINASSNSSTVTEKNGRKQITLIGDVLVTQGHRQLNAGSATLDQDTGEMVIDGQLTVREPDLLLLGDKGQVNQRANTLVIDNATYVIHSSHTRGQAQQISKQGESRIILDQSSYTQCAPDSNAWALAGSKIVIDTEKQQGVATKVRLLVKGIPIFYWPYLRFPVGDQRLSGFLFPSVAYSSGALNVSVPYYFNLAPNYDLTFTPHFLGDHGTLFEANGRHLSQHFETDITLAHLSKDKAKLSDSDQSLVNAGTITEAQAAPFRDEDRWLISVDQEGGKGQPWSTHIDYNKVSDNDYLRDFDTATLGSNSETNLNQQLTLGYQFKHWSLDVNTQQYQTLSDSLTEPYKKLPQISFDGRYNWGNWNTDLDHEWVNFDHTDANDPGDTTLVGSRLRLDYSFGWAKEVDAGFFRPRVQLKHLSYQLDSDKLASGANTSPSVTVPQAIIDAGLYFERDVFQNTGKDGATNGYLQTFEPRLFYFYSDFEDQSDLTGTGTTIDFDTSDLTFSYNQLFRDTRFSGNDRIDDANQLAIGLTSRFIHQGSGKEVFSASVGQILFFDDRRVSLSGTPNADNNSDIAAQLSASIGENWRLTNNLIYDDNNNEIDNGNLALKYRNDNGTLFNLKYRFVRSDISANTVDQAETSLITPFANRHWNLLAHFSYDFTNKRELEQLFGLEYNGCCYRARIAYQRFLDNDLINVVNANELEYDEGVIVEFQFYGLGGTGKQLDTLLDDAIDDYDQWQATHRTR